MNKPWRSYFKQHIVFLSYIALNFHLLLRENYAQTKKEQSSPSFKLAPINLSPQTYKLLFIHVQMVTWTIIDSRFSHASKVCLKTRLPYTRQKFADFVSFLKFKFLVWKQITHNKKPSTISCRRISANKSKTLRLPFTYIGLRAAVQSLACSLSDFLNISFPTETKSKTWLYSRLAKAWYFLDDKSFFIFVCPKNYEDL